MARCGIRPRHPVKIVLLGDDGAGRDGPLLGDAETLAQAAALAEAGGFRVRGAEDGGGSRFAAEGPAPCFVITVYPED